MDTNSEIARLVRMSLMFHHLNKSSEMSLGLSLVQYHLLVTLKDLPGCSPQKLAAAIGVHPSSLTQSLKRLHKKRVLFVGPDPKDSRKKILSITREGMGLIMSFAKQIDALMAQDRIKFERGAL